MGEAPHEVSHDEGCRAVSAFRAVDEGASVRDGADELEVVEGIIEDEGDILSR